MRRLLAVVCAGALVFTAPVVAMAQSNSDGQLGQSNGVTSNGQLTNQSGQDALAQAPPPADNGDNTGLLVAGGLVVGGAALAAVLITTNKSDNSNSSNPASP